MTRGRIQDLNRRTTAAERKAFEVSVFSTRTGATEIGILRWGDEVDLVERRERRIRVRADSGLDGWVRTGAVVEPRWIRRRGKAYTAPLYRESSGGEKRLDLLWGDPVLVLTPGDDRCRVWARGWTGYVDESVLGRTPLLELYFIDVGQGDGVLMRLPDGRHLLIDGGYTRAKQPTGKSAADFVDWKFFKDYGLAGIRLDAVVASHCDADHYGGLWDLLRVDEEAGAELDCEDVEIAAFFHAGVSWWRPGDRWLGRKKDGFLIDLLDGADSVTAALQSDADRRLQGEWAGFLGDLRRATSSIHRLGVSSGDGGEVFVPGFGADDGDATIRVLAPVLHTVDGHTGVRSLGSASQNTNGHSVLLRVDFVASRILLTGDLNRKSMRLLVDEYAGGEEVFTCDVAKGCHHGSDDVSYTFLRHVNAAATVISSGDNEGHGHPRPAVVAASGATGHVSIDEDEDELLTPLVYSTEVERSVALGRCEWLEAGAYPHDGAAIDLRIFARDARYLPQEWQEEALSQTETVSRIHYQETKAGALRPSEGARSFRGSYLVSGLRYGLVNVRTDGETVLCATMNEAGRGWHVRTFPARF